MKSTIIKISFFVFFITVAKCSDIKLQTLIYNAFPKETRDSEEPSKIMDNVQITFPKFVVNKISLEKIKEMSAKHKSDDNLLKICSEENREGMGQMNIIVEQPTEVSLEIIASYQKNNMCIFANIAIHATGHMSIIYQRPPPGGNNLERFREKLKVFSRYLKYYQLKALKEKLSKI